MKNKKVLITVIIVLVLIVAVVAGILILKPFDKENDEKETKNETISSETKDDKKSVDYEEVLTAFAEACKSEKDMEDFVEEYVDFQSLWAAQNSDEPSDLADVYNEADASDYEDEDFIEEITDIFLDFVSEDVEIEISDVEEDGDFSSIGIDFWKAVKFTASSDDEEIEMAAIFCDDKVVIIATPEEIDTLRELDDEDEDEEDGDDEEISLQEVEIFNTQFEDYEGTSVTAPEVKALLDLVVTSNSAYEEDGHFVSVYTYNVSGFDSSDLNDACFNEDVEAAATEISALKSKIVSSKTYTISFVKDFDGFIEEVEIEEE